MDNKCCEKGWTFQVVEPATENERRCRITEAQLGPPTEESIDAGHPCWKTEFLQIKWTSPSKHCLTNTRTLYGTRNASSNRDPPKVKTYGDLADTMVARVKVLSIGYKRVNNFCLG